MINNTKHNTNPTIGPFITPYRHLKTYFVVEKSAENLFSELTSLCKKCLLNFRMESPTEFVTERFLLSHQVILYFIM